MREIEEMEYSEQGIGCGLENENITDRYDAAVYGFAEARERIAEIIRGHMEDETEICRLGQKAVGEDYRQQIMGRFLRQE